MLFCSISIGNVEVIVNTIRKKIEENKMLFDNNSIQVTVSFGLAKLMGNTEEDFEKCFKTADEALYLAKTNGRNRVEKLIARSTNKTL